MAWKDVTLRQYQLLYPLLTKKVADLTDELDQQIELLTIMDGKSVQHYEDMMSLDFVKLVKSYEWVYEPPVIGKHPQTFKVNGIRYWVDYNPTNVHARLTGRDIIDLTTIANQDGVIVSNMNKILSAYVVPGRKWGLFKRDIDIEKELLDLDMETAYNITAFFLPLLESCLNAIQDYLQGEMEKQKEIVSTLIGDGKLPSTI